MGINVDAIQPGMSGVPPVEAPHAPDQSQAQEKTFKTGVAQFFNSHRRLGKIAATALFALGMTGISVTPNTASERPSPDSTDAAKAPTPVTAMTAGDNPSSALPEQQPIDSSKVSAGIPESQALSSAEIEKLNPDQREFIQLMKVFLKTEVVNDMIKSFTSTTNPPQSFIVNRIKKDGFFTESGTDYSFMFGKAKSDELAIDLAGAFLPGETGELSFRAQTGPLPSSDFPNKKGLVLHSSQEMGRQAERFLAKPPLIWNDRSDDYQLNLEGAVATPDGGKLMITVSALNTSKRPGEGLASNIFITGTLKNPEASGRGLPPR